MEYYQRRTSRFSAHQGNVQNMNPRVYSRQCGDIPDRYSINEKWGRNPRNNMIGTPIKKLISEEMLKELEPRKRSPGLIARLMGLDGLPPQQPFEKQQKWLLEQHSPLPVGEGTRKFTSSSGRNFTNKEQQFKDVFEVMDTPTIQGRSCSTNRTPEVPENDIDFILKKYIRAKRPTSNSTVHNPKGLDSNKELLSRFSDILHSDRNCQRKSGLLSDFACPKHSENLLRSSRYRFDKEEHAAEPTRIVILKPNLKRLQRNQLSPRSSDSFSSHGRSKQSAILPYSKKKLREASVKGKRLPSAKLRGYAGDESSTNISDCDSTGDLETNWVRSCGSYSPYTNENSLGKEAQKRISERWRMNQKSIDVSVNDGNTLGEMLSKSEFSRKLHHDSGNSIASTSKSLPSSPRRGVSYDRFYINKEASFKEKSKIVTKHESFSIPPKFPCDMSLSSSIRELTDVEIEIERTPSHTESLCGVSKVTDRSNLQSPVSSPSKPEDFQRHSNAFGSETKETEQPSPNSVLETSFDDDMSTGECFESLSADLQGLRKQLELLKMESETYPGRKMVVSSDEEWENESVHENGSVGESSMQSSYVHDILLRSGIDDTNFDAFAASCESFECPVSRRIFEQLEKKYCDVWQRHERMLLFDRTNCALSMAYWKFARNKSYLRWRGNEVASDVRKYLLDDDKLCMLGRMLPCESQWLDLGDDIDFFGRQIEKLLTEELIAEALC